MGKKGKKGKKGKVEYLVTPEALEPFDCKVNDIINTPLGVQCTVVGVREGALWLKWPGGLLSPATPAPALVHSKAELENYGYTKRPQSANIQRSIDEREKALYEHRRYDKPLPPTAKAVRLPLGKHGAAGRPQYAEYQANPGGVRPASAPAKSGTAKKK